jgi:pre-rRNA-processing protein TSR1
MTLSEPTVLAAPDPALQQSLQSEVPIDPMAGEQTWPTEEELAAAEKAKSMAIDDGSTSQAAGKTVRVPKGTSGYQVGLHSDYPFLPFLCHGREPGLP